jgi:cation transport regulator ChaB
MSLNGNSLYNILVSLLFKKSLTDSTDFHAQSTLVQDMLKIDSTGMVDSLSQFMVDCALTDISIDTESDKLNEIFLQWLNNINSEFRGKGIEVGIRGLMKEYFKERWRGSSFPVLKITKWDKIDGINFPVSMIFVDGGSVYAEKTDKTNAINLFSYKYFLGKEKSEEITGSAYLLYKLFGRSFDEYPTPYLIRRGIYKNWKLIDLIKDKELELIDRVIPYLLLITKGSEELTKEGITYAPEDLTAVKNKIQELTNKLNDMQLNIDGQPTKSPIRVTNWDEEIKHVIPDLKAMFQKELFEEAERNILAGLGFIDIAEATSNSRSQSVLNPKPFIKECQSGQADFANVVLKDLLDLVREKNPDNIKYNAKKWITYYNPMTEFMTDAFLELVKTISDRGYMSNETCEYICSRATVNYELEKRKRIREIVGGDLSSMYPKLTTNQEKDTSVDEDTQHQLKNPDEMTDEEKEKRGKLPGSPEAQKYNSMLDQELLISILQSEEISDNLVNSKEEVVSLLEQSRWIKKRNSVNYIRRGQINPNKFEQNSFRTINIDAEGGIKAIIGKIKGESKTTIQSYLFAKKKWKDKEVEEWLKNHLENVRSKIELIGSPYSNVEQLPKGVKVLPINARKMWMEVFNKNFGSKGELASIKIAWGAVKQYYAKNWLGKWRQKKGE